MFSHLELSNCLFHKGVEAKTGEDPKNYSKFEYVFTGHYHTKSTNGNIHYLGSPCEFTWIDCDDPKGFHTFDFSKRELTFIENPKKIYRRFKYDDKDKSFEDFISQDYSAYAQSFVKVYVQHKRDPKCLDWVVSTLENVGALKVTLVEDKFVVDNTEVSTDLGVQDTYTILRNYVEELEVTNKDRVELHMQELYEKVSVVDW